MLDGHSAGFLLGFAAILLGTGAVAGVLAGLLGVGGGIVIVPVLFLLFPLLDIPESVRMHLAVGTSLATIILTGFVSARSHHKRGAVDFELLRSWGPAIAVGVLVGTVLGAAAKGDELTLVFAVVALLVAANMAFRPEEATLAKELPRGLWRALIGFAIGGFSVVMGIGGGTLSVPILTLFSYPIRRAVGTASAIGLIIGVPGALGFVIGGWGEPGLPPFSLGYVNLIGVALIVPATMLTAPLGARLAHTIPPGTLRLAFGLFLAITGGRMLWSVLA